MSFIDDKDIIDITDRLKAGGGDLFNPNRFEVYLPAAALVLLLLWWGATGIRIVQPDEVGVVLTFGRYSSTVGPGLQFIVPWPVQEMHIESTTKIRRVEIGFRTLDSRQPNVNEKINEEALMLTGDENIVYADMIVQYRVNDPYKFLFNVASPAGTVKKAAEAALREVVGKKTIDEILTLERSSIQDSTAVLLNLTLASYDLGLEVVNVQLQDVFPPEKVEPAFKDVASAREDKQKLINQAEGYRNEILPKAEGEAKAMIERANAYKSRVVMDAEGEAARFLSIYETYSKAKEITRARLYIETMEQVLTGAKKILIDGEAARQTVPYLPMNLEAAPPRKGGE